MRDEENMTAAAKYAQVMEESMKQIQESARIAKEASDKAAKNGLSTRAEASKDKKSVNFTTIAAAAGMVITGLPTAAGLIWFLMNQRMHPVEQEQVRQSAVQVEILKDIRELYRVIPSEHSDRLERPVPEVVVPPKE